MLKQDEFSLSGTGLAELLKATLSKDASFRFKVQGFSMSPFIKDSDVVTVSPFSDSSTCFGRAVAFLHPKTEKLAIHRIVGKRSDTYIIKGDNAFTIDGLVSKENILGYVAKVERDENQVHLGLGIERFLIAFLSSTRILPIFLRICRYIKRVFI